MSRPRKHALPSIDDLTRRFNYDRKTGLFTHKARPGDDPLIANWNRRYADKLAGTVMNVGYWFLNVGGQSMLGHRVAWFMTYGEWPGELDHKDGNKLNNAISNLRLATRSQNSVNRRGRAESGFKGVRLSRSGKRWCAGVLNGRRFIYLGTFDTPELAHAAYSGAAKVLHGAFANLGMKAHGGIAAEIVIEGRAAA